MKGIWNERTDIIRLQAITAHREKFEIQQFGKQKMKTFSKVPGFRLISITLFHKVPWNFTLNQRLLKHISLKISLHRTKHIWSSEESYFVKIPSPVKNFLKNNLRPTVLAQYFIYTDYFNSVQNIDNKVWSCAHLTHGEPSMLGKHFEVI